MGKYIDDLSKVYRWFALGLGWIGRLVKDGYIKIIKNHHI